MKNFFVLLFFILSFNAWSVPRQNACPHTVDLTLRIGSGNVAIKLLRTVANFEWTHMTTAGITDQWSCEYLAKGTLPSGFFQFLNVRRLDPFVRVHDLVFCDQGFEVDKTYGDAVGLGPIHRNPA